ncbi:MAG: ABC transporter permease [Ruminococcus sp.]|nr:ABC transporter permease [Ruminococcus sp.]
MRFKTVEYKTAKYKTAKYKAVGYTAVLYRHEMKRSLKSFLIWTLCVGLGCFGCILLYGSLEGEIQGIADSFSELGAMSAALGMDKMSLATMRGYFATEIAMLHSLGGAMYAAALGIGLISKEQGAHTVDFLNVLPITRGKLLLYKYITLVTNIFLLNFICAGLYSLGFILMKEELCGREMLCYLLAAALMQLEIGTICFLISVCIRKTMTGIGLGIAIVFFAMDMMCRILPAIEKLKYITPFYFANAADIFTEGKVSVAMVIISTCVILFSLLAAWRIYNRKDL